ncbi:hypothetical protein [Photorhabdus luminescens]|uniref:hypothetical protein n=1 Tax=Photorhabdus luminescens TaxID=29488 RepID=UPI0030D6D1F5
MAGDASLTAGNMGRFLNIAIRHSSPDAKRLNMEHQTERIAGNDERWKAVAI